MPLTAAQRRLTAWFALWTVVLGALLPAVAQAAWRTQDRADWVEICTSTGMLWVKIEGARHGEADPTTTQGTGMSCPWCLSPHGGPALVPESRQPALEAHPLQERPPTRLLAAPAEPRWPSAHARAPPRAA